MTYRKLWTDCATKLPKLTQIVVGGEITLKESSTVFLRIKFDSGEELHDIGKYRKAVEKNNGKTLTVDEYFISESGVEYSMNTVKAWMAPPAADAINGEWLANMLNGDCDYCEHLPNLRDNSPCMDCIHAPIGSIVQTETTANHWELTKTYRESIEERTVYPG